MSIENLKTMKDQLMNCVQGQMGNLRDANTHELGEAVDMIKDLSEAIYYCTITESMEKADESKEQQIQPPMNFNYYTTPMRDIERRNGYMYYPDWDNVHYAGGATPQGGGTGMNYYTELPTGMMRDPREGRSPMRRRMYMEGKETHRDKNSQLRELEEYLKELSTDITEMVKDASPEERVTLREKMTTLASKIN
jgi:hypothetical protein